MFEAASRQSMRSKNIENNRIPSVKGAGRFYSVQARLKLPWPPNWGSKGDRMAQKMVICASKGLLDRFIKGG
jgi:hypothetical protein